MREAIGFEALHTAAFVVNADEQIFAHALNLSTQSRQLRAIFPITRKQNNAANQRMLQAALVFL
jgi:hypothetical protein